MKKELFNGVINVYKEKGYTSHDVVAIVRKTLSNIAGCKTKVGHTGTLDPDATGVLPICVGRGTKFVDTIMDSNKIYIAELFLGYATDTYDISGKSVKTSEIVASKEDIEKAIKSFVGSIEQVPPMYSAIKINGQKLYDLARQGIEVERNSREVSIYNIQILEIDEQKQYARFSVECSKGTYIRSLCYDIGEKLGTYGTMGNLERTKTSCFIKENSITLDELKQCKNEADVNNHIISVESLLTEYDKYTVKSMAKKYLQNGNKLSVTFIKCNKDELIEKREYLLYDELNTFLGIYIYENNNFIPKIIYSFGS